MSAIKLREAKFNQDDLAGMWDLFRRLFGDPYSSCSLAEFVRVYQHFWLDNPARTPNHLLGWILESPQDGVVGFIGLIPVRMKIGQEEIVGASSSSYAVLPKYRAYSVALLKKSLEWGEKSFLLDTTSSPVGNRLYEKIKIGFQKIPIKHFDYQMLWLIRPEVSVKWVLGRSPWRNWFKLVDRKPFSWLLKAAARIRFVRHRKLYFSKAILPVEQVTVFTDEFTKFWGEHKDQYGITTVRDRAFLQWRYQDAPKILGTTHVFACRDSGSLEGYLILLERDQQEGICPGHFRVLDVFYNRSRPEVVSSLMNHAFGFAKAGGGSIFEVSGVSHELQDMLRSQRPCLRQTDSWAYWYRAPTKELADRCECEVWWPSKTDGAIV